MLCLFKVCNDIKETGVGFSTVFQILSNYIYHYLIVQIPHEALVASIPNLVQYLKAPSVVVHSYAAHTIERILMVKKPDGSGPV